MIENVEYDQAWPDWHIGPEQPVAAHVCVWCAGEVMLPIQLGRLFRLACRSPCRTEPMERALAARPATSVTLASAPGRASSQQSAPAPCAGAPVCNRSRRAKTADRRRPIWDDLLDPAGRPRRVPTRRRRPRFLEDADIGEFRFQVDPDLLLQRDSSWRARSRLTP